MKSLYICPCGFVQLLAYDKPVELELMHERTWGVLASAAVQRIGTVHSSVKSVGEWLCSLVFNSLFSNLCQSHGQFFSSSED